MNVDRAPEAAPEAASERVCVVIWDGSVPEAELRRYLDDTLPMRFVRWQDRTYLSTIDQLRPRVIVAVEPSDELAADVAGLLACLVTTYIPTIIGMTVAPSVEGNPHRLEGSPQGVAQEVVEAVTERPHLLVRQLGSLESATIDSLADLTLG